MNTIGIAFARAAQSSSSVAEVCEMERRRNNYQRARKLVHYYINSPNPDLAIRGRELELAIHGCNETTIIPARARSLMRAMRLPEEV